MSDLEQELAGTLARVAEDAPGASGLADAARRRHRVRRQRRLALGGAAAALVVAFGAVVVSGLGGDDRATDPVDDPAPEGWQTISQADVRVSVPADWTSVDCPDGPSRYAPPGAEPCAGDVGMWILGSATYDSYVRPGVLFAPDDLPSGNRAFGGHVSAGEWVVSVGADSEDLVRRILSSARLDGQPLIDGATWVDFDRGPLRYSVPAWWGLGEDADRSGYSVCATLAKGQESLPPEQVDASHVVLREVLDDQMVTVGAPTQAVAELVLATVEVDERARSDAPCAPEDFTTGLLPGESTPGGGTPVEGGETVGPDEDFPAVGDPEWDITLAEYDGIAAEIPTYWAENFCNEAPQWTPYEDCTRPGEGLRLYGAGYPTSLGREPGVVWREEIDGRTYWTGYVLRGDVSVFLTHADRETAGILLDQVR